jgi:uncharacterized protein (TIGR02598 family)
MRRFNFTTTAFSLVEVTLALGIAAFCLIAVFGLMPIGVQTNRNATSQTAAGNIISAVVTDLRTMPKTPGVAPWAGVSVQFGIPLQPSTTLYKLYFDGQGRFTTSLSADSRYQVNVTFPVKGNLTYANIKLTWPAAVDPATTTPSGSVEMFAALDRN